MTASLKAEIDDCYFPYKEDEEWVDFEQETEKDYTGLRIQNLQINKDKSDQEDEGNDNENDDECDENGERREGAQGPWNVSQGQPSQSQQQQQQPQPQQPVPQAAGDFHICYSKCRGKQIRHNSS
uniref:CDV3-like protein n=1 Tax=Magallana gigas TaxID=29159 RepID=K1Q7Q0_MAGGI